MARIRTIKPEFFTSEDIVNLSPLARLLYIALWCEADKEGRLVLKPKTIKMRYFPGDSVNIEKLCGELFDATLVIKYGDDLAYIPKFGTHQHVNPRETESKLPAPNGVSDIGPKKVGKSTRLAVFDRDGHACVRCGSTDRLEADHILPQSCGGPHIIENLRTLCKSCNAARPVAGKALDDDLAKDGYSVNSLQVKFGIDASNLELHAQGGREGKGKEGKEDSAEPQSDSTPHPPEPPVVLIPLNDNSEHPIAQSMIDEWSLTYPAVNVVQELREMRTWSNANPSQRKTVRGVNAFVVRWLGKEQDKGGKSRDSPNVPSLFAGAR